MPEHTDEHGWLRDIRCHDGRLIAAELMDGDSVKLKLRRTDGTLPYIALDGVRYFAMNSFREGNIIDSVYLWSALEAPRNQHDAALMALSLEGRDLLQKNELLADKLLFVIES